MELSKVIDAILIWGPVSPQGFMVLRKEIGLVVVPENRPFLIGLRQNAYAFRRESIPYVLCPDNAIGLLLYKKKIRKTIIFAKDIQGSSITGVCGSLYAALLSKLHGVPVEVMLAGNFNYAGSDKDAGVMASKKIINSADCDNVIAPQDEVFEL